MDYNKCQTTWDGTINGSGAVLVNYLGGEHAQSFTREFIVNGADKLSNQLDEVNVLLDGNNTLNDVVAVNWYWNPWTRGAYSVYKPGQYAGGEYPFAGLEWLPEPYDDENKNCHFAGEAVSKFQGYMNGAVESGNRVAKEILLK
jgi:monoamine oxidase